MKRFKVSFIIAAVFLFSSALLSQQLFEGKVVYKMAGDEGEAEMTYFVKEGKMRIEVAGEGGGSMIFDSKNKTMLVMMPDEKMYMEMPMKMGEMMDEESDDAVGDFKKTGQKKEILGYACEKWIYKDDESEVESWVTKELGTFVFFSDPMEKGKNSSIWQSQLESEGFFPMELIVKDNSGDVESTMVVTSVEKKSLDDDMFMPPDDYQKLEMPGMFK